MGWWITLGVLVLLAILPLGVRLRYDDRGVSLTVVAGFVRVGILPAKKKKPKAEKQPKPVKAPGQKSAPKPKSAPAPEKKGGSVLDFLPLAKTALDFLSDFRRKLRVDVLEVKLIMAGGDPANLAENYGKAWAALGNLMPRLEQFLTIKKRDIQIECDFVGEKTTIFARAQVTVTLGRLIWLAVNYGIKIIRDYLNIQKKRKGGAAV